MTVATAIAIGFWIAVAVVGYALIAALLLFYRPSTARFSNGTVADIVFLVTVPFVLAVTWLAALRD